MIKFYFQKKKKKKYLLFQKTANSINLRFLKEKYWQVVETLKLLKY